MSPIKNAVIAAAGLGSRLGLDLPKCLVPFGKKRLIDYQLECLKAVENVIMIVGFKEKEVIDYVKSIRKDVIFVRNPDYSKTTIIHSLYLASLLLKGQHFLTLDADLYLEKKSFMQFMDYCCRANGCVIGVTRAHSENPVFTHSDMDGMLTYFSRSQRSDFEFSGIVFWKNINLDLHSAKQEFVYQILQDHLPIQSCKIESIEIDTPNDYERALNACKNLSLC
jgi:choline kinase